MSTALWTAVPYGVHYRDEHEGDLDSEIDIAENGVDGDKDNA